MAGSVKTLTDYCWLASFPRSGNTFFRTVALFSYNLNVPTIYQDDGQRDWEFIRGRARKAPLEPALVKTHDLPAEHGSKKAIYIVRDGRDAVVSYAHYIADYQQPGTPFEKALHWLVASNDQFGGWGNHVRAWLSRATAVIRFEDLIVRPFVEVSAALRAIGLPSVPLRAAPDFPELQAKLPEFFRRGQVGAWRDEMPAALHELFWDRYGDAMELAGYRRDEDSAGGL